MSVDLFCYTSEPIEKTNEIIISLNDANADLFPNKFSISAPKMVGENQKDIALAHNFHADSFFMIHLNDKNSAAQVTDVSKKVRLAFGGNMLILHNNDIIL